MFKALFKNGMNRAVACLLALITLLGMLPVSAFAAEKESGTVTAAEQPVSATYAPTGSFETNIAGATGWNGTRQPLSVYDAESGGSQILTVPASDGAEPIPFALLEYTGGSRIKIGLATDDTGAVTAWQGGEIGTTGWVDKDRIFVNLADLEPSIAYNLTNSSGSIFHAVDGREIPDVTGKQFYQAEKPYSNRLGRNEYVVPCMFSLAERLAAVQKAAMSNGDTLVIYETYRPAAVQSAVCKSFGQLWDSDAAVSADMAKGIRMGYARNQGWFIATGTSNHQAGLAVDMSLAKGDPAALHEYTLGGTVYRKYDAWTEYEMPTQMHELSSAAIRYKAPVSSWSMPASLENWTDQFAASEGAKKLQRYCTDAGLIPLASEWWHYNDPAVAKVMAKGSYAGKTAINTLGNYNIDRAYSVTPETMLGEPAVATTAAEGSPFMVMSTGDTGGLNPGSAGGRKPTTSNVAWSTDPKHTFIRFTLVEFPQGVVTDLTKSGSWRVVGTPLNVVWGKGTYQDWDAATCRSNVTWYNSCALQFNAAANPASLMAGTVYAYDAKGPHNSRLVTTADEFQAETGITDRQKEQMFNLSSGSWSSDWINGDYTSMWGTDPHPVTAGNAYNVYKANDAFVYLLTRLSETDGAGTGWSKENALTKWAEYVHDSQGNLRTKYRIIIETGAIVTDPDGVRRAYTLREMMAYSLYNNEAAERYSLVWDQSSTIVNMSQWMRQSKDNQFVEYPLREDGTPTGEELHSVNGFKECDSFVDTIRYGQQIRSRIFSERRSFGLHILNPFNFEQPDRTGHSLEVTKMAEDSGGGPWSFTVNYTAGTPSGFTAQKNGADCTDEVTDNGSSLQFSLKSGETVSITFDADDSFRFTVSEDDDSQLTNITGFGGSVDMRAKKFSYNGGGTAKVTFINGTLTEDPPPEEDIPIPTPGDSIVYKRDAKTNAGVGPATFKFASVTNGDYEFTTDSSGKLEPVQWWDPTGQVGRYIKPGEYTVTELVPPPGYTASGEVKQIKLELDSDGNPIQAGPLVFTDQAKPGLRIIKYDRQSHQPMSGVTFEIYRDSVSIGRRETDANGEIVLSDIEPGTYRAVEVDTGDGSHILEETYQEVELEAGDGIKELVFFNDTKPGLKLVKVDSSDLSKTISGARFRIRAVAGDWGPQEYTTDSNGEIDLSDLPTGSYEVTELECPGYVIDDAQRIIHLRANDTAQFVFSNTRLPGLRLVKTSADGTPLDGVTFKITPIGDASHSIDRTTANGGEIIVDGLEPGIYSVVETATRSDHILDPTEYHVELSPGKTAEIRLVNNKRPTLVVYKIDINGNTLTGAIFEVKTKAGVKIGDYTVGPDGKFTVPNTALEEGYYIITELQAPTGYILDPTPHEVYLRPNQTTEVAIENEQKPSLTILKIDSIVGDAVKGAKFEIWAAKDQDRDGTYTKLPGAYYTDDEGKIVLDNLDTGWYRIVEVEPPAGYLLKDPSEQLVYVEHDKATTVTFENIPKSALVIRKIDADTGAPLANAWFRVRYLGGTSGSGGTIIGEYQTSANGNIIVTGLDAGTYIVEEISAPHGYVMDTAPQTAYISGLDQDCITLTFTNSKYGALLIKKVDSVTGEPLSDVQFFVTDSDGSVIGNSNGYFTTDSAGTILISDIMPGTSLVVKETRTRPGYILDDAPQTIKIKSNETMTLEFRNQPTGGLIVEKLDSVTHKPLEGVEFEVRDADGHYVPNENGAVSSNGIYKTDKNGQFFINGITGTFVVTETKTLPGYVIDENTRSQTVVVNPNDTQKLTFYNTPIGGLQIVKVDEDTGERIPGVKFEVRKMNGEIIGTYTTDRNGVISIPQAESGWYQVTELKAADGYKLDDTPAYVCVKDGETATLEITNSRQSSLMIHKIDADTRKGIYGVKFVLYDSGKNPIMELETDQDGYAWVNDELEDGRYYIRELEAAEGYVLDEQYKTVWLERGKCAQITWENKAVTGQIQIRKYSEDNNPITGDTAGKALEGAVYEITRARSGEVVGYIVTDKHGVAASGPLPLGRYYITEVTAPAYYQLNKDRLEAEIEYPGQIIKLSQYDKSVNLGVTIKKTGNKEVQPGQTMSYTISNIANTSNVALNNFFWHDRLPTDATRGMSLTTGTYNQRLYYKVTFKTNLNDYRTLASNLLTSNNYSLTLNASTLKLAQGEYVTDVRFEFGTVASGFSSVISPTIRVQVLGTVANNYQIINRVDVGGKYLNEWQTAKDSWVTTVRRFTSDTLPKTGY